VNEDILDDIEENLSTPLRMGWVNYMEIYIILFSLVFFVFFLNFGAFDFSIGISSGVQIFALLLLYFFVIFGPAVYAVLWGRASIKYEKDKSVNVFNKSWFFVFGFGTAFVSLFYVGTGAVLVYKESSDWIDGFSFGAIELIFGLMLFLDGIFCLGYFAITTKKWQSVTAKHKATELLNTYMPKGNNKK